MRFSVDAHAIGRRLTGNETYVRNLLDAFAALDEQSEFIAYISTPEAARVVPRRFERRGVSGNPWKRLGWDLPRRLRADRPDLVHVQYTAPLACSVPVVVSVHDVSFLEHPEYFNTPRLTQLRITVRRTIERAARILTGSEFSRDAIVRLYGVDPDRIVVVPIAASPEFRPLARAESTGWIRKRFAIPAPYILSVGDLQSRKNQAGLIQAFTEMLHARPELPHRLVLTGQESWHSDTVHRAAAKSDVNERIHFTGYVSDEELLRLYNGCEFFVFPSFYEGFGLPVLEAMACGKPVACSKSSALYETADACALLFDPASTREMTRAMLDLALDAELCARMGRLGLQRSALFTWRKTAEKTLEVYYETAARTQTATRGRVSTAVAR